MSKEKEYTFNLEAANRLPANVFFGTSSWTYPGWQGLVYKEHYKNEKELKARCLEEYGRWPWFRTVGIDSSFYRPTSKKTLYRYAEQVPEGMPWVSKVWEEITIPTYAKHARYGSNAGKSNPNFLNAELFCERVLSEHQDAALKSHAGPFVFQFQALEREQLQDSAAFLARLDAFLAQLPKEFMYAVEIRNKELLGADYFSVLNKHGVTHCFNHWAHMPSLRDQMKAAADAGGLLAPFYVSRVLTPLGVTYQQAVNQFQPYNKLQKPNLDMRADLLRLAKRAIERKVNVFILINNRSEGCAPITIDQVGTMISQNEIA